MKIAFYTASHLLESDTSDSRYVYQAIREHFEVRSFHEADASLCRDHDVVFTRFPLPLHRPFLRALSERDADQLVVNDPVTQLQHTKRHLLAFPSLTVPTMVSTDFEDVYEFAQRHTVIVLKPLDRHKGIGITRLDVRVYDRQTFRELLTRFVTTFGTPVVQRYVPEVVDIGDKRINVIWFQPVSAVVTYPRAGSFICHEAAGGYAEATTITDRDRLIIDQIVPYLRTRGVYWAAVDLIGPHLGEINVLTPAMVLRADRAHGNRKGAEAMVQGLVEYQRATGTS